MSNYIRRRKSKAMQDPAGINNGYNFGGSGGSYIMRRNQIENARHNNIRKTKLYSLSSTNTGASSYSCCSLGERKVAPVVHYSYKTYMDMKLKGCSICPPSKFTTDREAAEKLFNDAKKIIDDIIANNQTPTTGQQEAFDQRDKDLKAKKALEKKYLDSVKSNRNVFKRMPDNSTEFYLENKKSKVFVNTDISGCPNFKTENTDCYVKTGCQNGIIIDARRAGQQQIDEIEKRKKSGKNVITLGRLKQKSYTQYMNSKKPVITKPRMFNYASLQTFAIKSRRVCGNKPFESELANIQNCKHI